MSTLKDKLIDQLIRHEGEELQVYECPAGFKTIGVGRNLETRGLSKEECDRLDLGVYDKNEVIEKLESRGVTKEESRYLLSNDIDYFTSKLNECLSWFSSLPETAKMVLIDMGFNIGIAGLLKFKKTLGLIEQGRYVAAGEEMLNSAWKHQVGQRAYDLSDQLKTCQ